MAVAHGEAQAVDFDHERQPMSAPLRILFVVGDEAVRNRGRLIHKSLDRDECWLCAGAVGAGIIAVAAVEAFDEPGSSKRARALRRGEFTHMLAPGLAFVGAAKLTEIMQRAQDFREPEKLAIVGLVVRGWR